MPTPLLFRRATLHAKIETTSGTEAVPTSTNSIKVRNLKISPVVGDFIALDFMKPYLGNSGKVPGAIYSTFEFEIALQSSGTQGTAPKMGALFRMCAMGETVLGTALTGTAQAGSASTITLAAVTAVADNALKHLTIRTTGGTGSGQKRTIKSNVGSTDVVTVTEAWGVVPDNTTTYSIDAQVAYAPVSTAFESATLYFNVDGVLHKVFYGYADPEFMFDSNSIPICKFRGMGVYVAPSDAAAITTDYTGWNDPVSVSNTNSSTLMRLHGLSTGLVMQGWSVGLKNSLVFQSFIGQENPLLPDRKPAGNMSLAAVTIATKDWFTSIRTGAVGAFSFQQGTVAGSILDFHGPAVQLTEPDYTDVNGQLMLQATTEFRPLDDIGGNNEFVMVAR